MKSKQAVLYLIVLIFLLSFGCDKTDTSSCGPLNFAPVNFTETCRPIIIDDKNEDKFFVINSLEELRAVLSFSEEGCEQNAGIFKTDFSKYTLIIGKKAVGWIEATLESQSLTKDCASNKITYSASIKNGDIATIGVYVFALITDKMPANTQANFDIKVSSN